MYTKRLKRDISNPDSYMLITDDNFSETSNLEVALNPFLCHEKGLHVAIICQDEPISIETLFGLFDNTYKRIVLNNITNESWEDGFYIYCSIASDALSALQDVIDCMKALGRDITNAQEELDVLVQDNDDVIQNDSSYSEAWTRLRVKKISNHLLHPNEILQKCGDIRILILLPEKCFSVFTEKNCYFPNFIELALKGISETNRFEALNNFNKIIERIKSFYENKGERIDDSFAEHIAIEVKKDFALKNNLKNKLDIITTERFDEINDFLERFLNEIQFIKPNLLYSDILARSTQNENSLMQNSMPKDTRNIMSDEPER